eukprot:5863250-Pyramimonas_sp.AAC.1
MSLMRCPSLLGSASAPSTRAALSAAKRAAMSSSVPLNGGPALSTSPRGPTSCRGTPYQCRAPKRRPRGPGT